MNSHSSRKTRDQYLEDLVLRYQRGDRGVGNKIVELCHSRVRHHVFVWTQKAPELFDDMYQEACIGIIATIRDFDPRKGSFTTLLWNKVRGELSRAVNEGVSVGRGGPMMKKRIRSIERARNEFYRRKGRYPNIAELSYLVGLTREEAEEAMFHYGLRMLSFETPNDPAGRALCEEIVSEGEDPAVEALRRMMFERALACMDTLTDRESSVIAERFLNGGSPSRSEAGRILGGISKQRVGQLELAGLGKIRNAMEAGRS